MNIIQQPDVLSLSRNLKPLVIGSSEPVSFELKKGEDTLLSQRYEPGDNQRIEIDLREIIHAQLSCDLKESGESYEQTNLAADFTAIIDGSRISFRVVKAGVDRLADTPTNFLKQNFLTWQPNVKRVTYSSPEFLTYYAVEDSTVKLKAVFTDSNETITFSVLESGKAWTMNLQYANVVKSLNGRFPAYYDVWVENASGQRMTYIQRYQAETAKSIHEDWVLFENSLGGIDTFRAYGTESINNQHTHNIAELDEEYVEYRVDTERLHTKNTGYLTPEESRWLVDFFPAGKKYIYLGDYLRSIVVTESEVQRDNKLVPTSYSFTYKYADARPLLNLPRTDEPVDMLELEIPEVGNFTIPPRLAEVPRLPLSEGDLFPVQNPYSETWSTTTTGALASVIGQILSAAAGDGGGIGHSHANIDLLNKLSYTLGYLLVNSEKIKAGYADEAGKVKDGVYIRKDQEDETGYIVKFLAGLEVGEFVDSLSAGKGTKLFSDGRGQMNILELRKQIQIGEAILFWDDTNKGIGVKRASSPASEDGTGEVKENEIGIYSLGWMSAKGIDKGEEEGSGAGSTTIGGLTNVGSWADQTADYDRIMVQLSGSNTWTEKRLDEIGGGLDEEQLAAYLTENNYAKIVDIPSLDGYATQSWVLDKGYATTSDLDSRIDALVNGAPAAFDTLKEIADVLQGNVDSIGDILTTLGTKADKSISILAGTGLAGGGTLSANRTLSLKPATTSALGGIIVGDRLSIDSSGRLTATYTYTHPSATATTIAAATGKVLSAITVNSLGHVTSVAAKTLAAADIPSLAISKITGLQDELDKKLDKSVLDDLFEKVTVNGVTAIRAKYGLFTNEFMSAKGMYEGEEGGSGSSYLSDLLDVYLTSLATNDLLKWNGTKWINVPQSSIVPNLVWENITGKPSWIGSSKPTYTFGEITSKPTTVSGYGITDAYKVMAGSPDDNKGMCAGYYANVGSYASFVQSNYGGQLAFYAGGTLKFRGINNNFAYEWKTVLDTSNYATTLDSRYLLKSTYTAKDILEKLKTVDGAGSGLDADSAEKLNTNAGSALTPVYFSKGIPISCSYTFGNLNGNAAISNGNLCANLNADKLDGVDVTINSSTTGIKKIYVFDYAGSQNTYIKLGTLPTVASTGSGTSKAKFRIYGGINFGGREEATWEVIASTRSTIYINSTLVNGAKQLKVGYVSTSSGVEIWAALDDNYITKTAIEIEVSENFIVAMTRQSTKPSGFTEGSYRILIATDVNGNMTVPGTLTVNNALTVNNTFRQLYPTNAQGAAIHRILNYTSSPFGLLTRIYSNGNVGIQVQREADDTECFNLLLNHAGGNVGIGTTAPTQKLHVAGNILSDGAITAKAVSDIRLKTIVKEKVDYRYKLLELGSVIDFYYNDKAIDRNTGAVDKERHIGLIYQLAKTSKLVNFCHEDKDGYGSINYLSTDYINLIAGALQQTIRKQETIEQRIARLEKENKDLKIQLNKLSA